MADPADSTNRMDLSLNPGPPSPSHLGSALGLGSSNDETHGGRGSIREPELVDYYLGNHDLDPSAPVVSSSENGEDDALQARHRWRRIRPTILDSDELHHPLRRTPLSVPPLLISRIVDSNGRGTVDATNNNNNNLETNGSNPEMPAETLETRKEGVESLQTVETAREADESSTNVTNFECNVCLDMAREPVVTSCGHLFCWGCLYLWLHVHSSTKECPVCKGEVTEMNITPIYGRGNSNAPETENKVGEHGEKVPPRPHARRIESLRPISPRVVEAIRLSAGDGADESRVGVQGGEVGTRREDEGVEDLVGAAGDQILNRLRLQRETVEERWRIFGGRSNLIRSPSVGWNPHFVDPHFAGDDYFAPDNYLACVD